MVKINLNKERIKILNISMPFVSKEGWNDNIFNYITRKSKYKINQLKTLFPEGYISILELHLSNINEQMIIDSKKLDLNNLRTHEKIREIILLRLKNTYLNKCNLNSIQCRIF